MHSGFIYSKSICIQPKLFPLSGNNDNNQKRCIQTDVFKVQTISNCWQHYLCNKPLLFNFKR
jgi:hypothetical protein